LYITQATHFLSFKELYAENILSNYQVLTCWDFLFKKLLKCIF
jgi:hypothetical protein